MEGIVQYRIAVANCDHREIAVDAWRNQPNHSAYNARIKAGLNKIQETFGLSNPDLLFTEIGRFENYLRNLVVSNPNVHLNDIVFTYIP